MFKFKIELYIWDILLSPAASLADTEEWEDNSRESFGDCRRLSRAMDYLLFLLILMSCHTKVGLRKLPK